MFSGERGPGLDFADIVVSIPPDNARQIGEVQKPRQLPGNPATDFVTLKADYNDRPQAIATFPPSGHELTGKQVLVFVHGFNNRFEDAVFRFAQFVHDSGAATSCPSSSPGRRGAVFSPMATTVRAPAIPVMRSKTLLRWLAKNPEVGESHRARPFDGQLGDA